MEREKIVPTAGRDALGSFAPDFARYNDDAPACDDKERFQKEVFLPIGEKNPYGKYFTGMSHLALEIPGEDGTTEWCEPVSDKLYGELK